MPPVIPDPAAAAREQLAGEVADLFHAVNRRIRRATHQALEPVGITPGQARALRTLGRHDGPLRMTDLAARLRIARRSATTVVDELAARGLVARHRDPTDRRVVAVAVNSDGARMARDLDRRRREAAARLTDRLPARDLATLADLLRRLDQDGPPQGRPGPRQPPAPGGR